MCVGGYKGFPVALSRVNPVYHSHLTSDYLDRSPAITCGQTHTHIPHIVHPYPDHNTTLIISLANYSSINIPREQADL